MSISLQRETFVKHSLEGHTMWLMTILSVRRPRFGPRVDRVEFLVDKLSLKQIFLQACSLSSVVLPQCFMLIFHSSVGSSN